MHYTDGVKWAKIDCWDVSPFCGRGGLNYNAKKHLDEGKEPMSNEEMNLLGSLTPEAIQWTIDNWDRILEYAVMDANLTASLKRKEYA